MIVRLSDRSKKIKPSFTLEMTSKVAKLKSQGVDVINFSAGQPDFNTPKNIINAATKAMDSGLTKYTSGSGMIELREAICNKLANENYISANINQVLVSNGLIGFFLLMLAFFYISKEMFLYRKNMRNKVTYNKKEICKAILISAMFINLWPFIPSGNFFNNWLSMLYFYPVGFYLYFKHQND